MSLLSQVRVAGAQTRMAMLTIYDQVGPESGEAFSKRFLWEIGEAFAEVRGPRLAAEAMYQVADAIAARAPSPDLQAGDATASAKPAELAAMEAMVDELEAELERLDSEAWANADRRPPPMLRRVFPWVAVIAFAVGLAAGWALAIWKHS